MIADSLMRILIEGPDVSFNGSPTVSPITAAVWASVFFLKTYIGYPSSLLSSSLFVSYSLDVCIPVSIYFLALSQAPPVFENEIAI